VTSQGGKKEKELQMVAGEEEASKSSQPHRMLICEATNVSE